MNRLVATEFSASDALKRKVLAADFSKFPGDIIKFDDDKLHRDGLVAEVNGLEEKLGKIEVFGRLEQAMDDIPCRPADRKLYYRWFCLVHLQNAWRREQSERLENLIGELSQRNFELIEELTEGTFGFVLRSAAEGKLPTTLEQLRQATQQWRERKTQSSAKSAKQWLKQLKRSGRAVACPILLDWTQPHTVQEYVDYFCTPAIHGKKVRVFLREFPLDCRRRGRGRNKPLEYTFYCGLKLYEKAITDWVQEPGMKEAKLMIDAIRQVSLPTALTPEGFRFRELLAKLFRRFVPTKKLDAISPGFIAFVQTKADWVGMNRVLQRQNSPAE